MKSILNFHLKETAIIILYRQKLEVLKLEEYEKQRMREEKRKEKHLKKLREQEQTQLNSKIRSEEKKLLIAQRKLESIRALEALFERIKVMYCDCVDVSAYSAIANRVQHYVSAEKF